ncbi:MAG: sodium:alanine symporter family protein [Rikenellaceae bacterium]
MQQLSDFLTLIDSYIGSSQWFVYLLLGTGLFFTVYLGFPQIRYFRHAMGVTMGKFDKKGEKGDTSHFGALTTALSGTIGTGNIAGVALAIHLGGPPALFWMLMTAALGMATKMVEVTLSTKYREIAADGTVSGGPMYYMKNRLGAKWLAVIFAVATIFSSFGTGSLPQINSIANSFEAIWGIDKLWVGIVLALLLGLIVIGGIKRIAKVAERIVPAMSIIYFTAGLFVLIYNYDNILPSLGSIFSGLWNGTAATGGFLGAGVAWAFNRGVNRGLFSNEAGQGSAPIAHSAARTSEPVSEGLVSLLEPFIDTIIICFTTGLILLSSGVWNEKFDNTFQSADTYILESADFQNSTPQNAALLSEFITAGTSTEQVKTLSGTLTVESGTIKTPCTILHSRSVAEDIIVRAKTGELYSGTVEVKEGKLAGAYTLSGKSLLHSAPLTTEAFKKSHLGFLGGYVIPLSLLLFAFSTALAWSYYGDRAMTFLFGVRSVPYFRIVYVVMFAIGAFVDTTIIWIFSGVTIALMALPNLIGILILHKDVKGMLKDYTKRVIKK